MKFFSLRAGHSERKYAHILGVRLDSTSKAGVLEKIGQKLSRREKFYIVTPNPEIILAAQDDRGLKAALDAAFLSVPDGIGLVFAAKYLGQPNLNLLPGRKLMLEILSLLNERRLKVFLLGSTDEVIAKCIRRIKRDFPTVAVEGYSGPRLTKEVEPESKEDMEKEKKAIDKINKFAPDFLFLAFGAPKQEKWIAKWLPRLKIGGAMVVGGALDYYAGFAKLPPEWLKKLGLEWLWRLIVEPWRLERILNATVVFPLRVFQEKLKFTLED